MAQVRKSAVKFKGSPVDLEGPELKVGDTAPADFSVAKNDMSPSPNALPTPIGSCWMIQPGPAKFPHTHLLIAFA